MMVSVKYHSAPGQPEQRTVVVVVANKKDGVSEILLCSRATRAEVSGGGGRVKTKESRMINKKSVTMMTKQAFRANRVIV
jgi:hypothetical protein